MSRIRTTCCWLALILAGLAAAQEAQQGNQDRPTLRKPDNDTTQQGAEQLPPEEDAGAVPQQYSFNPLQSKKEVTVGEFYLKKGDAKAAAVRGAFTIERTFKATPAQVFKAFTDERAKSRWFAGGGDDPKLVEREMDVRPGGREVAVGKWKSGVTTRFDAYYFDVVPDRRLVYAYEMHLDGRKISVSLACVEIEPHPAGVKLKVAEQAVFLDGYDDNGSREHGTNFLMDKLVASLAE